MKIALPGIILIISGLVLNVNAQNKPEKEYQINLLAGGGHLNTSGAITFQNHLAYQFHRLFMADVGLTSSNAASGIENQSQHYSLHESFEGFKRVGQETLYSAGLNFLITPVKSRKHRIGLGGGASYNYQLNTYAYINGLNGNAAVGLENTSSNGIGFNLVAFYNNNLNEKLSLGIRAQGIYFDDSCEFILLQIGYKINRG